MIEKQVERKFEPFLFDEKVGADIVEGGVAYLSNPEIPVAGMGGYAEHALVGYRVHVAVGFPSGYIQKQLA